MLDVGILGQVAFGYSPFIDNKRAITATRLTVFPLKPDASLDAAQLLHAVGGVWPADGPKVSLNVASESLLHDLLNAQPAPNVMIEIPAFMASDPVNTTAINHTAFRREPAADQGQAVARAAPRSVALLQILHHRPG